jgi:hypothetical protein
MTGDPWIIHNTNSYTSINIKEKKNDTCPVITAERKPKNSKGWLARPKEISGLRDSWTTSDFIERPYNWEQQENEYDEAKLVHESELKAYTSFCKEKIAQIPAINHLTSQEMILSAEEKILEATRARMTKRHLSNRYQFPGYPLASPPPHAKQQKLIENMNQDSISPALQNEDEKENAILNTLSNRLPPI